MMNVRQTSGLTILILSSALMLSGARGAGAPVHEAELVAQAKQLIDTYYGNRENLRRARELLRPALAGTSRDAAAYVQAARVTVMSVGGRLTPPDTVAAYHALLDKAIAIEPANAKAHILKAEAYDMQNDYSRELAMLQRAKALGTTDPWLLMGYGRYYEKMGDPTSAYYSFRAVMQAGAGSSPEDQRAYIAALGKLPRYKSPPGDPTLKELAAMARRARHPDDAWVLGNFAHEFVSRAMFDDGIIYAKEALNTMDYGAGRMTLTMALFGKAAELIDAGKAAEADKYVVQAKYMGFDPRDVLERLERSGSSVDRVMPTLRKIVN